MSLRESSFKDNSNKENIMGKNTPKLSSQKSSSSFKQSSLLSFFKSPAVNTQPASSQDNDLKLAPSLSQVSSSIPSSPLKSKSTKITESLMSDSSLMSDVPSELDQEKMVVLQSGRAVKRKPVYAENDSDYESESIKRQKKLESMAEKKRKVRKAASDNDDGEFIVDEHDTASDDNDISVDELISDDEAKELKGKLATPAKFSLNQFSSSATPTSSTKAVNRTPFSSAPRATPSSVRSSGSSRTPGKFEKRYEWLENIRDANKNAKGDPDYNERTLYIPESAWRQFSAFESQYWEIKSQNFDTVVFFKKGKFYELYENDADIGHQLFDLKMTDRVNMRMVGVPEATFDLWAGKFVAKGYKVARVDQMESAVGKTIREKNGDRSAKTEKVLRRELSYILTRGTLVDSGLLVSDDANYCMSLAETAPGIFGVALVDTSLAKFYLCDLIEDAGLMKLETLLVQCRPIELCLEKNSVSFNVLKLLKTTLPKASINYLSSGREFWTASRCRDEFDERDYFNGGAKPQILNQLWSNDSVMQALGGLTSYLDSLKLDKELISLGNFHLYEAVQCATSLVLDGQTLVNLDVFANGTDGSESGTLFGLINNTATPFGKRLLRQWLCHPLRHKEAIESRLRTVDSICEVKSNSDDFSEKTERFLRALPDLPRILSRVHAASASIKDFLKLLNGLDSIFSYYREYYYLLDAISASFTELLSDVSALKLREKLTKLQSSFDYSLALRDHEIIPFSGFDEPYDAACQALETVREDLNTILKETRQQLNCGRINFKDMGKELFQLEIPNSLRFKPDHSWMITSSTKDVTRYYTPKLKKTVQLFVEAEEVKADALRTVKKRLYSRLDESYKHWLALTKLFGEFDCLHSLALTRERMGPHVCRPEFVDGDSLLEIEGLRHPCMLNNGNWIPNDIRLMGLSNQAPQMLLLTGPNMGGKSTLLRETCLAVILAQIGCYVPADSFKSSCVDRIFTRIGASDNILAGQSTFMVELTETSRILSEATPNSLVILDELGRGTSTFDGYAIAFAVLFHLVTKCRSLGLFSTHYHMLTEEFADCPSVGLVFMDNLESSDGQNITFLYKLRKGVASKSFGMHVARMANVPSLIIDRAQQVADEFEKNSRVKLGSSQLSKSFSIRYEAIAKLLYNFKSESDDLDFLKALKLSLPLEGL